MKEDRLEVEKKMGANVLTNTTKTGVIKEAINLT
jgi:hypothetical protein